MKINKILFIIFSIYISAYSRDILQYHTVMSDRNANITLESININTNKTALPENTQYDLNKELDEYDQKGGPTNSSLFVRKEIGVLSMSELGSRITLRMAMTPPLYLHVPPQAIMSIEPLDRRMSLTPRFLPSLTLGGVKQAMMKTGGDFPHLEAPEDTFTYILCHIKKWDVPDKPLAENSEQENQPTQENNDQEQKEAKEEVPKEENENNEEEEEEEEERKEQQNNEEVQ